ncbi:MAG: cytochrome b [Hyphomicrobiaceae bacterium]
MPKHEHAPENAPVGHAGQPQVEVYSPTARRFHWYVVALILVQFPLGWSMTYRGGELNIWDSLTNTLYSSHKLIGIIILLVVILRLGYRLVHGAPKEEPTLETWHRHASATNHWGLYALLVVVPVLGWLGVSYYPALDIFGLFKLPGLVASNKEMAEAVFGYHEFAAAVLLALVGIHIAAALYHYFIRGDNVLARMIPRLMR